MIAPRKGCLIWVQFAAIAGLVFGLMYVHNRMLADTKKELRPPVESKTAILQRIHLAGELTTAIGCVQTVVKSDEIREWLKVQVGTVEILYVAVGEIRAGINLMDLEERSLVIEGTKATVTLPQCRILHASIDVNRSYVFDVKRSMVLSPQAVHLQTAAERKALAEIQETAVQVGLLQQAEKQAQVLVRYFLESSGIREVAFRAKEAATSAYFGRGHLVETGVRGR